MAPNTQQKVLLVNEDNIALLKNAFADNEELLVSIRNLFFGFQVSDSEKAVIRSIFSDPKLKAELTRRLMGRFAPDLPIGTSNDFWAGTEQQILGKFPDEIAQVMGYKQRCKEMFEVALNLLDDPNGPKNNVVDFNPKHDLKDTLHISLLARNQYIKTIETTLVFIKAIAGTKSETPQQAKKRLEADSSK